MTGSPPNEFSQRRLRRIEGGLQPEAEAREPQPTVLYVVARTGDGIRLSPLIMAMKRWGLFHQILVEVAKGRGVADPADAILIVRSTGARFGPETPTRRVGRILAGFEHLVTVARPQLVVLPNGTEDSLACALAAAKLGVPIAQLDAGMRTGERREQAELNRILTDRLSDLLLTSTGEARRNLLAEGVPSTRIHVVGSTLIDSVRLLEHAARERAAWDDHGLTAQEYVLVALAAAPATRRARRSFRHALRDLADRAPLVAIVQTEQRRDGTGRAIRELLEESCTRFAAGGTYLERLSLAFGAGAIITDVGDLQEEASALGVPCYTLGPRTERTITVSHGTNTVLGEPVDELAQVRPMRRPPAPQAIPLWDGHAADRAAEVLVANTALRGSVAT